MDSVVRLVVRGRSISAARRWLLILFIGLLAASLALPIYAAKGGNGKGDGKGGTDGGGSGGADGGPTKELHFKWRVPLAGPYSAVRPAVGPDGSIYAVDVFDNLFAVSASGNVQWSAGEAGSKGLDVGPDGTIYTGNENWIKAFNPDGSLKWTFVQSPRAFVLIDVAVGPDGHLYAVASSGMGVFSLRDNGAAAELRWTNPEAYGRPFTGYAEIAFGPATDGSNQQLYFHANGHTRAVRLSDGQSIFTIGGNNQQPRVSPLDGTWHVGDSAYSPDGTLVWMFEYPPFTTAREPSMGQSGNHYAVNQARNVFAIDSLGVARWTQAMDESVSSPDVDPSESQVLLSAGGTSTNPVALKSVSAVNGSSLWRMEFPADGSGLDQFIDTGLAYSAAGGTAYVVTAVAGGNASYLNAINTDASIPSASTRLRSTNIALSAKQKGKTVTFTGDITVLDENRGPVSGAVVHATWTMPDGTVADAVATTGGAGEARFTLSADGGLYWLAVTGIEKSGFDFDPAHSVLEAGIYGF